MSYAPGHDGPPVSELPYLTDRTGCTCEYACVDHYYAERWDDPDDGGDQWIRRRSGEVAPGSSQTPTAAKSTPTATRKAPNR